MEYMKVFAAHSMADLENAYHEWMGKALSEDSSITILSRQFSSCAVSHENHPNYHIVLFSYCIIYE